MTKVRKSKIKKILSFELLIHPSSTKMVNIKVVGVLCNYKLHMSQMLYAGQSAREIVTFFSDLTVLQGTVYVLGP